MTTSASKPSSGFFAGHLLSLLPGWLVTVALLLLAIMMAPVSAALVRPLFLLGCLGVGVYAWRQSTASHLQAAIVLFCFAPFARRVVDFYGGYNETSLMLIGPLLTILVPAPRLIRLLDGRSHPLTRGMAPIIVVFACVCYATFFSAFQGQWMNAATGSLKWFAPLIYAMVLIETGERDSLMQASARIFEIVLPIMGLYGIYQYIDPPGWDRYWMDYATILSAGLPLPYEIRVYSTLNGPASFATFTAAGILIVSFLRPALFAIIVAMPASMALLLSQYRTAWMSLGIGILFCLLFARTRWRSGLIIAALAAGATVALTIPAFNEALTERLQTFSQGTQDGSFQERLQEFVILWSEPSSSLFGLGFTIGDVGAAGTMPVDGMFIACWLTMGLVVGIFSVSGFIWASARMILRAFRDVAPPAVVLGGLGCGSLIQMPLANLSSGELGVLFWTYAAIACLPATAERRP